MSFIEQSRSKPPSFFTQFLAAILGGAVLFLLGLGSFSGGYRLLFTNRIFPGISMAGVDLSSMTPADASAALNLRLTYPTQGKIVFQAGSQVWVATPADLGMTFDVGTSVQRAYALGRQGGLLTSMEDQLNAWQGGLELAPVMLIDQRVTRSYLESLASAIDQPVIEANLQLNGTEVVYTPGQVGRAFDIDKAMTAVVTQLESFQDGQISLLIEEKTPQVLDAAAQAQQLRQALSAPLTLDISNRQAGDPGPWTLDPSRVADLLIISKAQINGSWQYQVSIDSHALQQFLGQLAPLINQASQNARFHFDDSTGQLILLQPSITGRTLDVTQSASAIGQQLLLGAHAIPLVIAEIKPQAADDATASSLGISGLIPNGSYTSYFRGSSQARMQNIQTASQRFDGLLVAPGETFSMGAALGDISLENGYAEALIIYNGQTILGVGGGVCQVSTTLYRTAYFSGYPIVERHEHAYRVRYYEQTATGHDPSLAGLDATVYFPLVDLKFKNDRPYWLLMETYFNPDDDSLTWSFYSTDDGRTVNVQNLGLQNVVASTDPVFEVNPGLAKDEISQDDWWYEEGADITVTRVVTQNGNVILQDSTQTHYVPHPLTCQYGPGTADPQKLADKLGVCQQ